MSVLDFSDPKPQRSKTHSLTQTLIHVDPGESVILLPVPSPRPRWTKECSLCGDVARVISVKAWALAAMIN